MFKNSVHTSKRTHFTITKINLLTLFKEIIAVTSLQIVKIAGTYNYLSLGFKGLKHNDMALQPKLGPGLPFCVFVTMTFLQGWIISPAPNPQPGGPGLRICDPRRQGGPAIPPGTGYTF
jgi:hypothetical protein